MVPHPTERSCFAREPKPAKDQARRGYHPGHYSVRVDGPPEQDEALALRLKVTPSHLALWIQGIERPPVEVFLRAVDLVSDQQFERPEAKAARSGPEL